MQGMTLNPAWISICALLVGGIVRLLKDDGPLPWAIPPRARAWAALAFGVIGSVLTALKMGTPMPEAVAQGLSAGLLAITGHELVIEGVRGGRELFTPKPPPSPPPPSGSDTEPSMPPANLLVRFACAGLLCFSLGTAAPSCTPQEAKTVEVIAAEVLTQENMACIASERIIAASNDASAIALICHISEALTPYVVNILKGLAQADLRVADYRARMATKDAGRE